MYTCIDYVMNVQDNEIDSYIIRPESSLNKADFLCIDKNNYQEICLVISTRYQI